MEVRAQTGRVRMSARKARLVVDVVRGRRVLEAQEMLRFLPNKAAHELEKLMKSVAANAENNYDLDPEDLWIKESYANEGPTMRRFKAKARGRVGPIKKRSCSITVIVDEREERPQQRRPRPAARPATVRPVTAADQGAAPAAAPTSTPAGETAVTEE